MGEGGSLLNEETKTPAGFLLIMYFFPRAGDRQPKKIAYVLPGYH